ncbi:MAG: hypothetical protein RMJ51_01085 [Candidatus Calescibacterium sp.]|nr:hypothetical protein [Candidatus Calescibacterium sp.]MCX7972138.1 hypothetical protein [bacterium]MDW8194827.1 hypothetical protein [Candidatus Calescibacterium sp.]
MYRYVSDSYLNIFTRFLGLSEKSETQPILVMFNFKNRTLLINTKGLSTRTIKLYLIKNKLRTKILKKLLNDKKNR